MPQKIRFAYKVATNTKPSTQSHAKSEKRQKKQWQQVKCVGKNGTTAAAVLDYRYFHENTTFIIYLCAHTYMYVSVQMC